MLQDKQKLGYHTYLAQQLDLDTHVFNSFTWDWCYRYLKAEIETNKTFVLQ